MGIVSQLQKVAFDVVPENGVWYLQLSGDYPYAESEEEAKEWCGILNMSMTRARQMAQGAHETMNSSDTEFLIGVKSDRIRALEGKIEDLVHDLNNEKEKVNCVVRELNECCQCRWKNGERNNRGGCPVHGDE